MLNPHKSDSSIKEIIPYNNCKIQQTISELNSHWSHLRPLSTSMLLLQEWMQAASFLTTVSGSCISKHHSNINSRTQLPFWNKMIDNQYLMMFNVWWFRISHSISRFEASEPRKNNCRSSNTAPSEFAFRSLGGASNVPGKQGTSGSAENPVSALASQVSSAFQVAGARCAFSNLMVLYLFHLCSKFSLKCLCMSLHPDKPQPRLHALFFCPVWRGSPFGITPKTQYMLRPSLTDVATKQKCRDFISHHGNACHMHKIDQDCMSCYKQKDWMQKMFALINLQTFLPDCMKNRRTDTPVTECRWSGRRHCQGQGWYPKWFN